MLRKAKVHAVLLVVSIAVFAVAVPAIMIGLAISDQRVTSESYDYILVVRVTQPAARTTIMAPTPDFPQLIPAIAVSADFPGYTNTDVSLRLNETSRGRMLEFEFNDSFVAFGSIRVPPGTAGGTLTLSSQTSNRTWLFLSNNTGGMEVSIVLYYERIQLCCLRAHRHSFVGTSDPRSAPQTGLVVSDDYLQFMLNDPSAYQPLSAGWNACSLSEGAFTTLL